MKHIYTAQDVKSLATRLRKKVEHLETERENLVLQLMHRHQMLKQYGRHQRDCAINHPLHAHKGCDCGWNAVLDESGGL